LVGAVSLKPFAETPADPAEVDAGMPAAQMGGSCYGVAFASGRIVNDL